jgi:hypothetical protein
MRFLKERTAWRSQGCLRDSGPLLGNGVGTSRLAWEFAQARRGGERLDRTVEELLGTAPQRDRFLLSSLTQNGACGCASDGVRRRESKGRSRGRPG